jgi:hypothetical protein
LNFKYTVTTRGAGLSAGKPLATHGGCGIMLGHGIGKILLAAIYARRYYCRLPQIKKLDPT